MKIIGFVEGAFPNKGGIGLVGTQTILASVAAHGHQTALCIAGPHTPGRERYTAPDLDQAFAKPYGKGTYGMVSFPAWGSFSFSPSLMRKAMRHVRDADFVSLHSFYSFPVLLGYALARLYRKPYGIWPHGVFGNVHRRDGVRKKWLYDTLIGRRVLENASVIFYSAKGERSDAEALNLNVPSVIIPDGIDTNEFANLPARGKFRDRWFGGHQGPLVVFIARLTAKKGIDLLAQSMALVSARLPQARLAIVGAPDPASFKNKVAGWVAENNISSSTVITGQISPQEKLEALADADVFVLPSAAENFGFSMFEAMASGVPVVVSKTLDYGAEVAAANAGLVVDRDPHSFSQAILDLLADPARRALMGSNGRQLAAAYSWDQTGIDLDRAVRSIVTRQPLPSDLTRLQVPDAV